MNCGNLHSLILLYLGVILTILQHCTNAALISGRQPEGLLTNESSALSMIDSAEFENLPISENSTLTESQGIKLKEIRKLARLAGLEKPEKITEFDPQSCYKNDCIEAAKEFYISMDFSKDPCMEWEKFACEWRTLSSKTALHQQSSLALKVENQVRDILQDPNIQTEALESSQEYFKACLAWYKDPTKVGHITKFLQSFGSWPLLEGSDFEGDWIEISAEVNRIAPENVTPFILKFVAAAVSNNRVVLQIDFGSTQLEMDKEDIHELLQRLRKSSAPYTETELDDIRDMQNCIKKLSVRKSEASAENSPTIITLENFQEKLKTQVPTSKLNIIKFVKMVFDKTDLKISPKTEVLVSEDSMIKYFTEIALVSQRALANIMFLQLATLLLGDTTGVIQEANFLYLENYKRQLLRNPTKQCIMETSELFGYALSEEYIRRHYKLKSNEIVSNMTTYLKKGFVDVIDSMKWLQQPSQEFLKTKIHNLESIIGSPSWIFNSSQLILYYSSLRLTGNSSDTGVYLKLRTTVLNWLNGKSWTMKLNDDVMDGWNYKLGRSFVGDTNVEYIPSLNQIRVAAGALQPPLFSDDFPGFMNFGGIGSVIARELAKIADLEGIYVSSQGDFGTWLDEKSLNSYLDWSVKLQSEWKDQKDDISLNDKIIHVLAYHITMNGYKYYLDFLKVHGREEDLKLPGLVQLKPEILLLIKYSNVLCEDQLITRLREEQSNHQVGRIGLIPVSRTKHFLHLFDCDQDKFLKSFDLEF